MSKIIKRLIKKVLASDIPHSIFKKFKRGPVILLFHGVEAKPLIDKTVQLVQIPVSIFEKQIRYLKENYEIIPMDYLYDCLKSNRKLDSRYAVLTFDDGYKNNLYVASPLLKMHKIPFTVFISTKNIDEGKRFDVYTARVAILYVRQTEIKLPVINKEFDLSTVVMRMRAQKTIIKILKQLPQDKFKELVRTLSNLIPVDIWLELNARFASEEPLNWEEVRKLREYQAIVGSHGHDHVILHQNQSLEEIISEIKRSKELIERNMGACNYFSFPSGGTEDINKDTPEILKRFNYLLGFTGIFGRILNSSPKYILPRVAVPPSIDELKFVLTFKLIINNSYKKWYRDFAHQYE